MNVSTRANKGNCVEIRVYIYLYMHVRISVYVSTYESEDMYITRAGRATEGVRIGD